MELLKGLGKILFGILLLALVAVGLVLAFLWYYPSVGKLPDQDRKDQYKKTTHYADRQFQNEQDFTLRTGDESETSDRVTPARTVTSVKNADLARGTPGNLGLIWYGHSSTLVQLGNQTIFLDPILSVRASPVTFAGPKRFSELAVSTSQVPEVDVVFVSHDHYDHLDYRTILALDEKIHHYIVPLGIDSYLEGWGIDPAKITALDWWNSVTINNVRYTLTPAQHYSGRNPLAQNATLWGGIHMTDGSHSVYYTGDTGYCDTFSKVYARFGAVDLLLADSGQYDQGWASCHMTPEEAVQAAKDAHAAWYMPVHWGAFVLANHAWDEPAELALSSSQRAGVDLLIPQIGEKVLWEKIDQYHDRWWEPFNTEASSFAEDLNSIASTLPPATTQQTETSAEPTESEVKTILLTIDGQHVPVLWADNDAVRELEARLADGPLEISLSMYSTFEQVGALGFSLSAQDESITTQPGDIMLYNGDQIVLFYGENTWAYTSLGRMDLANESLEELLGDHNVTITLRLG